MHLRPPRIKACLQFLFAFPASMVSACSTVSFSTDVLLPDTFSSIKIVDVTADSALIVLGPEYEMRWPGKEFFGEQYRDLWTTPILVPVLNLSAFNRGFASVMQEDEGGRKTLRLRSLDEKAYFFHPVYEDPKGVLPAEMDVSTAPDVPREQISSFLPAGFLVVDALANALCVFHPHAKLVLLRDDREVGTGGVRVSNMLGVLERDPVTFRGNACGFSPDTIVSTLQLFKNLLEHPQHRVNSRAYLAARLLDILVGNWDQGINQWRWGRVRENRRDVYVPILSNYDKAFMRFDGIFPKIATTTIGGMPSFSEDIGDVPTLTYYGRIVDRRILVDLEKSVWDSVTLAVSQSLTDEVIDEAVRRLPPPYFEKRGTWLLTALKSRLSQLKEASDVYYDNLSRYVDIHLSDRPEDVAVKRLNDHLVEVSAYRGEQKSSIQRGEVVYRRLFDGDETKEVRVYLHGGENKAVVSGDVDKSLVVRVIGGEGNDELVDTSYVRGYLWGLIPFIPQADLKTYFYDHSGKNTIVEGPGCSVDTGGDE